MTVRLCSRARQRSALAGLFSYSDVLYIAGLITKNMTFYRFLAVSAVLAASLTSFSVPDGRKGAISRGIGVYPGNPDESFAPRMVRDGARRNLALNRIVSTSSDFDYNLTGQLLTDGIICNGEVSSLEVFTPQGPVDKKDRESAIDGGEYSRNVLEGEDTWLDYRWSGYLLRADSVAVACEAVYRESDSDGSWRFSLESAGEDGRTDILGSISGDELPGRGLRGPMHTDPNKQTAAERMPMSARTKYRRLRPPLRQAMTMTTARITGLPRSRNSARENGIHPVRRARKTRIAWDTVPLNASAKRVEVR